MPRAELHQRATFIEAGVPKAARTPSKGAARVYESKMDGLRCLIAKNGKTVRLYSRMGWLESGGTLACLPPSPHRPPHH
jgi:hypothetical protein